MGGLREVKGIGWGVREGGARGGKTKVPVYSSAREKEVDITRVLGLETVSIGDRVAQESGILSPLKCQRQVSSLKPQLQSAKGCLFKMLVW